MHALPLEMADNLSQKKTKKTMKCKCLVKRLDRWFKKRIFNFFIVNNFPVSLLEILLDIIWTQPSVLVSFLSLSVVSILDGCPAYQYCRCSHAVGKEPVQSAKKLQLEARYVMDGLSSISSSLLSLAPCTTMVSAAVYRPCISIENNNHPISQRRN